MTVVVSTYWIPDALSEMSGIDQRCQRVRPVRPCDLLFGNLMITSGGGGGIYYPWYW